MTSSTKNIEKLIEMLNNPKATIRYEACEYLRVAPLLTADAIKALDHIRSDPDPDVAEAAQRALAAHAPSVEPDAASIQAQKEAIDEPQSKAKWTRIEVALGGIVALLVTAAAGSYFRSGCTISNYSGNLFFIFIVTWGIWLGISSAFRGKDSSGNLVGMFFSLLVIVLGAIPCIAVVGFWIAPVCN